MKYIKTMAIVIAPENYPMAVACLPAGYATIPPSKTFGDILIINEVTTVNVEGRNVTTLKNSYMSIEDFARAYRANEAITTDRFHEVERVG